MAFTTKKITPAIGVVMDNSQGQPPVPDHETQHQGGIRGKLDSMHSKANASVIGQRNKTHKAGNQ